MHKTLIIAAASVALGGFASVPAALAQTGAQNNNGGEASSAQQLVKGATQTVRKIEADSRFDGLLKRSKGVFIMPTLVKGGLIIGGEGAQGVLVKHNGDGSWSDPAFVSIGSVSFGAQAGGKAGPAAMILMTTKALGDFSQANNFSLNANAGLTIIGYSAQGQAPVGKGDIVLWSDQSGAFAGAAVSGGDVMQNTTQDHAYYGKQVDAQQILGGQASNADAQQLKSVLPG